MNDTYHLDLSSVPLDAFFSTLRKGNISPGRSILLEDTDGRRKTISTAGVQTLGDLIDALKTKKSLASFATKTALTVEYLTILRRQGQSWLPSPVQLSRFPGVAEALVTVLGNEGITHSKHLWESVARNAPVAPDIEVSFPSAYRDLVGMADLVRVPGIGPVFARAFLEIDIVDTSRLASNEAAQVALLLADAPTLQGYNGPPVTQWDIEYCVWFSQLLQGQTKVG